MSVHPVNLGPTLSHLGSYGSRKPRCALQPTEMYYDVLRSIRNMDWWGRSQRERESERQGKSSVLKWSEHIDKQTCCATDNFKSLQLCACFPCWISVSLQKSKTSWFSLMSTWPCGRAHSKAKINRPRQWGGRHTNHGINSRRTSRPTNNQTSKQLQQMVLQFCRWAWCRDAPLCCVRAWDGSVFLIPILEKWLKVLSSIAECSGLAVPAALRTVGAAHECLEISWPNSCKISMAMSCRLDM